MATTLPKRKKKQIKRFFRDGKKVDFLRRLAEKRGDVEKQAVFHTTIAGRRRTVKLSPFQRLAEANLSILQREHKKAVKEGTIKPRHYTLATVPYVYTDERVGIMETMPGIGSSTLQTALHDLLQDKPIFSDLAHIRKALEFCRRNPEITIERLENMKKELNVNLRKVSAERKHFSYDLDGTDNIIVMGVDKNTGALKIVLVDQIYPGESEKVRKILASKRKKSPL